MKYCIFASNASTVTFDCKVLAVEINLFSFLNFLPLAPYIWKRQFSEEKKSEKCVASVCIWFLKAENAFQIKKTFEYSTGWVGGQRKKIGEGLNKVNRGEEAAAAIHYLLQTWMYNTNEQI